MRRVPLLQSSQRFANFILQRYGWSQKRLAEVMAVDASFVSRVVNGQREMSPAHFDMIASALDVPTGALMIASMPPEPARSPKETQLRKLCEELIVTCDRYDAVSPIARGDGRGRKNSPAA